MEGLKNTPQRKTTQENQVRTPMDPSYANPTGFADTEADPYLDGGLDVRDLGGNLTPEQLKALGFPPSPGDTLELAEG